MKKEDYQAAVDKARMLVEKGYISDSISEALLFADAELKLYEHLTDLYYDDFEATKAYYLKVIKK